MECSAIYQSYSGVPAKTHLMPSRVVYAPLAPVPHPLLPSLPGLLLMTPDPRDLSLNPLKRMLFLISSQRLLLGSLVLQSQHRHPSMCLCSLGILSPGPLSSCHHEISLPCSGSAVSPYSHPNPVLSADQFLL